MINIDVPWQLSSNRLMRPYFFCIVSPLVNFWCASKNKISSPLLILYVLTHFLGVCVINFWCRLLLFYYIFCTNRTLHMVHSHARWKSWGVSFSAMSASQCFGEFYAKIHLVFVAFCRLLSPHQSPVLSSATASWSKWITTNSAQRKPAVFVMSASLRWLKGECQAYPILSSCIFFIIMKC